MNRNLVFTSLGKILKYYSFLFFFPLAVAFIYKEDIIPFFVSFSITILTGLFIEYMFRPVTDLMGKKEGYAIVGLGWITVSAFGAIPYLFYGLSGVDAFFESMSGFTTTGSTILTSIESYPRSLLFWRSMTQWVGGMGIIVLFVAIFPTFSVKGGKLIHAEAPGPTLSRIKPRIRDTAISLWSTYMILTLAEIAILMALGVGGFDAINHAFTTMATGGFSTHSESIAYFSPAVQWVIILFMILAGSNFALHYYWMRGNFKIFRNPEFRAYLTLIFVFSALLVIINNSFFSLSIENLRHSAFQVTSIMTTTGYTTVDYELWGAPALMLLLTLMFVGGCSGSTAGSIKVARIYLLAKYAINELFKTIDPRAIKVLKYGEKYVPDEVINGILAFFVFYVFVFVVSSIAMALLGLDMISAISSVATTLGNVGPGLGVVGPSHTFASLPPIGKIILTFDMWVGRLEIFAVLSLFVPDLWRKQW